MPGDASRSSSGFRNRPGSPMRRARLAFALVAGIVAIAALVAAIPLRDATARAREDVARNRLMLDVARARTAESLALAHADVPARTGDVRAAIERVLLAQGLHGEPVAAQAAGAQSLVIEAAPFDALVRAIDALARDEGVRVVEATLTARVDPGTVRAELVLAR